MTEWTSRGEQGFSLIELLVVVLIIGLLASVAVPVFLGQTRRAQDASAKSNARNLVSEIESCHVDTSDYRDCDTAVALEPSHLPYGPERGHVEVTSSSADGFTIVAHSVSGNDFTIERDAGETRYSCTTPGRGGCPTADSW